MGFQIIDLDYFKERKIGLNVYFCCESWYTRIIAIIILRI